MSVITAYKCDATGKLFEDKDKYVKHIRKIAAERRAQRKADEAYRADQQWWHDNFWNRVRSIDQLKAAILHHKDVFAARGVEHHRSIKKGLKPTPLVRFDRFHLYWSDRVNDSTYRRPPIKTDDASGPLGGWVGRFDYIVQSQKGQLWCYPGSDEMWEGSGIHTGTGGGGGHKDQETNFLQSFGYSICLFAVDWPAMAREYEKAKTWLALNPSCTMSVDQVVEQWNPAEKYFEDLEK